MRAKPKTGLLSGARRFEIDAQLPHQWRVQHATAREPRARRKERDGSEGEQNQWSRSSALRAPPRGEAYDDRSGSADERRSELTRKRRELERAFAHVVAKRAQFLCAAFARLCDCCFAGRTRRRCNRLQ